VIANQEPLDPGWTRDFARLEDSEIKRNLSSVPFRSQVDLFFTLDPGQRLRLIANSDAGVRLVRALPEEDLLLTLKETGPEDCLPLVASTSPSQLRFMLDVDLWRGDCIDERKAVEWFGLILACGERKVIQFVQSVDHELLVNMLAKLITLIPNDEDVRVPEGLSSIMPDAFFTIVSNVPERSESVRLFLRVLRQWDRDEFYRILYQVHGSAGAESEHAALRWRNSRLEEKGLVEFEEAIEIYGYIGEGEARSIAEGSEEASERAAWAAADQVLAPMYPLAMADFRGFLYEVLGQVADEALRNRLRREIAFCANRLLVADAERIGEPDSMRGALRRLFALANVGLQFLAGTDKARAGDIVARIPVRDLFQIGFSRVVDLRSAGRELIGRWWPNWPKRGFVLLPYAMDQVLRGILMRVPKYWVPRGVDAEFRDFETLAEVGEVREIVERIGAVADACFENLGIPAPDRVRTDTTSVLAAGSEQIELGNLLATGFVRFALRGEFGVVPVSRGDMRRLFEEVLEKDARGGRLLRESSKAGFLAWLSGVSGLDGRRRHYLLEFARSSLAAVEEEIGGVETWQDVDPRYVTSLVLDRWDRA
jgi:hypothetical protein